MQNRFEKNMPLFFWSNMLCKSLHCSSISRLRSRRRKEQEEDDAELESGALLLRTGVGNWDDVKDWKF